MFFTDSVYNQILGKTTGSTGRRRLDKGVFENLLIPFPSIENQNKIVSLMQSAYQQKKQKAQEADNLINSIDDFVLDELGIKLPELQDKKCFVVNSEGIEAVSYTHLRAHETVLDLVCRLLLEKKTPPPPPPHHPPPRTSLLSHSANTPSHTANRS